MMYAAFACRGLIGLVFAVAAVTKVRSPSAYREFASWLAALPVPMARNRALPAAFVAAEVAIVALVAVPVTATAGLLLAAGCLAVMTAGTAVIVKRGARVSCQCFGPSSSPLGARHILRDGILLAIALVGTLGTGRGSASPAGIALSLVAALIGATFVVFSDDLIALFESDPAARPSESSQ
jgi:Methylamine utilisation protein MauE